MPKKPRLVALRSTAVVGSNEPFVPSQIFRKGAIIGGLPIVSLDPEFVRYVDGIVETPNENKMVTSWKMRKEKGLIVWEDMQRACEGPEKLFMRLYDLYSLMEDGPRGPFIMSPGMGNFMCFKSPVTKKMLLAHAALRDQHSWQVNVHVPGDDDPTLLTYCHRYLTYEP